MINTIDKHPPPLSEYQIRYNRYSAIKNSFSSMINIFKNDKLLMDKLNNEIITSRDKVYSFSNYKEYNNIISTSKILTNIINTDDITQLRSLIIEIDYIYINDFYTSETNYLTIDVNFINWANICKKFYEKLLTLSKNDYLSQDIQTIAEYVYLNAKTHIDIVKKQ